MAYFSERFDAYAYPTETITGAAGRDTLTAELVVDMDHRSPWTEEDGHGPVSEWTTRAKLPGELVLNDDGNRQRSRRYYDFAEACRIARRAGWGMKGGQLEGETDRAYAARAARHDFEVLRAWCNDEWQYVGVAVTASIDGIELGSASLWGIECNYPGSDNSYLTDVAEELAPEAIEQAEQQRTRLAA